jgi:hypothetical protein
MAINNGAQILKSNLDLRGGVNFHGPHTRGNINKYFSAFQDIHKLKFIELIYAQTK